jgi:hypothetical protein
LSIFRWVSVVIVQASSWLGKLPPYPVTYGIC